MEAITDPDGITATALLNCLGREVGERGPGGTIRLPRTGVLLRAREGRWLSDPEVFTGSWQPLSWHELAVLVTKELGDPPPGFLDEIAGSRSVIAEVLAARPAPPADLYQRSEQALVAGHRYHPAPKGRGGLPAAQWLPYAPEVHARFPLARLEGEFVDDGDVPLPPGVLPAHPWQLSLLGLSGTAAEHDVWPTSSVRTVYDPVADLFYKFSLDVQITNDVRRLWAHDLRWIPPLARLLGPVFADLSATYPGTAFLVDRGYRTSPEEFEGLAVVVRDGLRQHTLPGVTPLLAAGISEGFEGNPLDGLDPETALRWFRQYVSVLVPPVLHAFFAHGVVMECHLQNVLVGVDATGMPVQAIHRDPEGMRLLPRHAALLSEVDASGGSRGVSEAKGWERLQYCLVVNHLVEIAGAVLARHPGLDVWAEARSVFLAYAREHGPREPLTSLLASPSVPAKANLLLRWTRAEGAAGRYVDHPNPLRLNPEG
ncbi:Siderophore synthetase component [Lentzea xinjiangensis]|uniref:Siderophore synthetase component n=1 Tax=Lentzea xinjiangensis TaxID=402600 RepID=A0A1H9PCR6_9PSEU|nr:IucA/IucC family C-terminal-domain containing protein [Lentzea xinjiangensis]SER45947.1 Siderophore synthetase component [Lentzea xinjiangensis]